MSTKIVFIDLLKVVLKLVLFLLITSPNNANSINQVIVERNPKDPFNPKILVNSSRPETHYEGNLHLFDTVYGMRHVSLKMEMLAGQHECYYFVLMDGYHFTAYAASLAADENKFHMLLSNSDPHFQRIYSDQTSVVMELNITATDTYELCLINPHSKRSILISAIYYLPVRYDAEIKEAVEKHDFVSNVSETTAKFISGIELNIGKALNSLRYKPNLRRDYVIIRDSNTYVQWKSIAFICLMMLSSGGTTLFIHYLFHVPKGKVVI